MIWQRDEFDTAIRTKKHYGPRIYPHEHNLELNWDRFIKLYDTHPPQLVHGNVNKKNYGLHNFLDRSSTPKYLKNMSKALQDIFYKNKVSLIAFGSWGCTAQSFNIHRDTMDVIYMQGLGETNLSIWKEKVPMTVTVNNVDHGEKEKLDMVQKNKMKMHDTIWIPRGTFHLIEPINTRVSFSFGIEGDIDPSTYI
tara:strand:- start:434 stop:1018 length:585 start_codon:yes stop_codon:yes gene_type:complete